MTDRVGGYLSEIDCDLFNGDLKATDLVGLGQSILEMAKERTEDKLARHIDYVLWVLGFIPEETKEDTELFLKELRERGEKEDFVRV